MAELKQLWENDRLEFHGSAAPYKNYYTFKELLNTCYAKEWIPYCKKPFDGAESVIRYLGKYTNRIAISNYRIKDMTESTVTFSAKDYKNQGLWKEITISGEEFIRRFLMHVPPKRFVRIRHYGLLYNKDIKNIEKQHVPSLLYAMRIADFFHQPVTNIFCYHPGQTQCKGADHNGE